jgi:hypothetical protein
VSEGARKRAEAAKQYIENMLTDKSKHLNEKKQRCVRSCMRHVPIGCMVQYCVPRSGVCGPAATQVQSDRLMHDIIKMHTITNHGRCTVLNCSMCACMCWCWWYRESVEQFSASHNAVQCSALSELHQLSLCSCVKTLSA